MIDNRRSNMVVMELIDLREYERYKDFKDELGNE